MGYTTDRFLRGVYRRVSAPANNDLDGDSDVLELADDITLGYLVPKMVSVRQDYFVTSIDQAVTAGVPNYDLPARAVGLGLRDLKLRIATGLPPVKLVQIAEEEEGLYRTMGQTCAYYFRGDQVWLCGPPSDSTWVLELWHEQRPSRLCLVTDAAKVASVSGDVVTLAVGAALPSGIVAATLCDVVKGRQGHRILGMDLAVASVTAGTDTVGAQITFAAGTLPAGIVAGDWVSLSGTTPVIQLPDDACVLLETYVSKRLMGALGDLEARSALTEDEAEEAKNLLQVLEPRNRGESRKTVNHSGLLRGRSGHFRRGRYG